MIFEIFGILVFLYLVSHFSRHKGTHPQPPGPLSIPFFGNLIQIALADPVPYLGLHKLGLKYGPIMSLKFGFLNSVIISSYTALKDVLSLEEASSRHVEGIWVERNFHQNIGIAFSNGENWKVFRRFCIKTLRDYGFGKRTSMQQIYNEELHNFVEHMKTLIKRNNGIIHFDVFFQTTVLNILWGLITGKKNSYEDKNVVRLMQSTNKFHKSGAFMTGILTAYPMLRLIFPTWTGYNTQLEAVEDFRVHFTEMFKACKEDLKTKSEPDCFIDVLVGEIIKNNSNDPDTIFTENQFVVTMTDLFQGGSETTASALGFGVLFVTLYPEIQSKVQAEIKNVIGYERPPSVDDREKMNYTNATILEFLRWSRVVVSYVPRVANEDFVYDKLLFKKGTVIFGNQHSIHFEKEFWGDPDVIRPERYLDANGLLIKEKCERVLPFGAGKRLCIGENLSRDSLFLYFTTLVQHFTFNTVPGQPVPTTKPVMGVTMSAAPFDALVTINNA